MNYEIFNLDCRDVMDLYLPDNSVDAIVTDPPYGLSFMGKEWDHGVPGVEFWTRALRVLKPGGHLLAFGGTRTYHWLAANIETAGFEIRDQIMWVYGSGFPKSLDVSKAIDKAAGAEREVVGLSKGKGGENLNNLVRDGGNDAIDAKGCGAYGIGAKQITIDIPITAPATEAAKQWQGWGTALKPAFEPLVVAIKPICVARKPLIGTVAANVLHWGTGALNIDGCRVGDSGATRKISTEQRGDSSGCYGDGLNGGGGERNLPFGRWPANLIHDGSDEVVGAFPDAKGQQGDMVGPAKTRGNGIYGDMPPARDAIARVESETSAARFFYCAKASRKDRNEGLTDPGPQFTHGATLRKVENTETKGNTHPTVKPTDLMAYLCRLVTPAGGVVFDPFMGSGSTGKAALREGFRFIGCEKETEYSVIAEARLKAAV